jgi:hypothetical protein
MKKTQKFRLQLNRQTVSNLNQEQAGKIKGGATLYRGCNQTGEACTANMENTCNCGPLSLSCTYICGNTGSLYCPTIFDC